MALSTSSTDGGLMVLIPNETRWLQVVTYTDDQPRQCNHRHIAMPQITIQCGDKLGNQYWETLG
jgi:hypothetical protein